MAGGGKHRPQRRRRLARDSSRRIRSGPTGRDRRRTVERADNCQRRSRRPGTRVSRCRGPTVPLPRSHPHLAGRTPPSVRRLFRGPWTGGFQSSVPGLFFTGFIAARRLRAVLRFVRAAQPPPRSSSRRSRADWRHRAQRQGGERHARGIGRDASQPPPGPRPTRTQRRARRMAYLRPVRDRRALRMRSAPSTPSCSRPGPGAAAEPRITRRIDTLLAGFNQPRRLPPALYLERRQAEHAR